MRRISIVGLFFIAASALALSSSSAVSQQKSLKDQIVGSWELVSWEQTMKDGSKNHRFSSNPRGLNTYDANGNFSLIIMRDTLPKISSGNPEKPTAEEAQAITVGSIAYFGKYTVDEATKTVSLRITATTLANQLGMEQKRMITAISDAEMKYQNPVSVTGGNIALVWKRAK